MIQCQSVPIAEMVAIWARASSIVMSPFLTIMGRRRSRVASSRSAMVSMASWLWRS
jgi:hypothetical protein